MTGYLQRLVASVIKPTRVHPVLAPMFSAPEHRHEEESAPLEDITSSSVPSQEARRSRAEPSGTEREIDETVTGRIPSVPTISHPLDSSAEEPAVQLAQRPLESHPLQPAPAGPSARAAGQREVRRSYAEYPPLLPEVSAPPPALHGDVSPAHSQGMVPPASKAEVTGVRNSSSPHTAPDDIQITIGRIEVAAVPATRTQSPVAQAKRKPLSLDEYLKRADARRR